jgi:hypothetical protein
MNAVSAVIAAATTRSSSSMRARIIESSRRFGAS